MPPSPPIAASICLRLLLTASCTLGKCTPRAHFGEQRPIPHRPTGALQQQQQQTVPSESSCCATFKKLDQRALLQQLQPCVSGATPACCKVVGQQTTND